MVDQAAEFFEFKMTLIRFLQDVVQYSTLDFSSIVQGQLLFVILEIQRAPGRPPCKVPNTLFFESHTTPFVHSFRS